jgi:hypothetical protein
MSKLKYAYLFRQDFENAGDLYSTIRHYSTEDKHGIILDVYNDNIPNIDVDVLFIGGGAIFSTDHFTSSIEKILEKVNARFKIVWGVGISPNFTNNITAPYDLFGIRDNNVTGYDWTPCPSVLHNSIFTNLATNPTKKFLVINHWKRPINFPYEHTAINNKNKNVTDILDCIADHEYVFTSSYHGAYWSTLLGKKTFVISETLPSKFFTMKHSPIIANSVTDDLFDKSIVYKNAFEECLTATQNFRNKIENLIGVKFNFTNPNFN